MQHSIGKLKNKHVYCTNCKHFEVIHKENDFFPYCKYDEKGLCDVCDCEDSRPLYLRPMYKNKDKIICLVGPIGTGKTSIAYALKEKYGYNVIESYTARLPRYEGEKRHTLVETRGIKLWANAQYEYWIIKDQYKNEGISIYAIDVCGVKTLRENVKDAEIVVIALYVDEKTRAHRLLNREEISNESNFGKQDAMIDSIERKMIYDQNVFAIIPCDYSVDANVSLEEVVERVNSIILDYL